MLTDDVKQTVVQVPTNKTWFDYVQKYEDLKFGSCTVLKDFGYMRSYAEIYLKGCKTILEFGHGTSPFLSRFPWILEGRDVSACDKWTNLPYQESREKWYSRLASNKHTGVTWHDCYLQDMQGKYDCVFSVSVLEELSKDDILSVKAQARRLLNADGYFVGTIDFPIKPRGDSKVRYLVEQKPVVKDTALLERQDAVIRWYGTANRFDRWTTCFFSIPAELL